MRLSLCMIVGDSARTLDDCLASIKPFVDEMIVVDTGSVDETPRIAERHSAKLFHFPWRDDFAAARNESLTSAAGEWLFWMDSDDTIDPVNAQKLRDLADGDHARETLGYVMQVHCPHGVQTNGDESDFTAVDHVKLFRNLPELRFEGRIHEQILPSINRLGGRVEWTDIFVVHSGAEHTTQAQARKLDRDLRLLKLEEAERPDHPFTLFNLGMTHLEMHEPAKARAYLERSIAVAGPHESHVPKAYSLLIQALSDLGRHDLAREQCRDALRQFPEDPELLFRSGVLCQHAGRFAEAEGYYLQVLSGQFQPRFRSIDFGILGYKARHNLAGLYAASERHADAESQWRLILDERPRYFGAWRGLVQALLKQDRSTDAEHLVASSPVLDSVPAARHRLSAEIDAGRGDFRSAREKLQQAVAACPEDAAIRDELCRLLFEHGEPLDAEAALRELVELRPTDAAARHNLGQIYLRQSRPHQALAELRQAIELRPESDAARRHFAEALRETGVSAHPSH
jgi:tetratricopeptide (TPR) repeat protein